MWDTISSGKSLAGEIKNMRSDGKYYWVYSYIIPLLDDSGIPFQYISIRNEITSRKEAEELLAIVRKNIVYCMRTLLLEFKLLI